MFGVAKFKDQIVVIAGAEHPVGVSLVRRFAGFGAQVVAIGSDIFTGSSATGGFLGATIAYALNRGVNRGLFSNEAGQGSAPIAHAAADFFGAVSSSHFFASSLIVRSSIINFGLNSKK